MMTRNTTEDKLGLLGSAHTSSNGTIVIAIVMNDCDFDSHECSDDGESRCDM